MRIQYSISFVAFLTFLHSSDNFLRWYWVSFGHSYLRVFSLVILLLASSRYLQIQLWKVGCSCWVCHSDHHFLVSTSFLDFLELIEIGHRSTSISSGYFWTCICSREEQRSLGILESTCYRNRTAWVNVLMTRFIWSKIFSGIRWYHQGWGSPWKYLPNGSIRCIWDHWQLSSFQTQHYNLNIFCLDFITPDLLEKKLISLVWPYL